MVAPKQPVKEGWFHTPGRLGDRSLDQQLMGLDPLFDVCKDKTVLDVGCAEGLISIELAKRGARAVHGVEIIAKHVEVANRLGAPYPISFEVQDASEWTPKRDYDIVLLLAILHKFENPTAACARLIAHAREWVVFRTPPRGAPTIIDARSGLNPHYIGDTMKKAGFVLTSGLKNGPFDEWVGYYKRVD
jgi:2-polyprenyl-3-methyl-5-hydroxy-6-metoxy-1,4-benzoquinol methylase